MITGQGWGGGAQRDSQGDSGSFSPQAVSDRAGKQPPPPKPGLCPGDQDPLPAALALKIHPLAFSSRAPYSPCCLCPPATTGPAWAAGRREERVRASPGREGIGQEGGGGCPQGWAGTEPGSTEPIGQLP